MHALTHAHTHTHTHTHIHTYIHIPSSMVYIAVSFAGSDVKDLETSFSDVSLQSCLPVFSLHTAIVHTEDGVVHTSLSSDDDEFEIPSPPAQRRHDEGVDDANPDTELVESSEPEEQDIVEGDDSTSITKKPPGLERAHTVCISSTKAFKPMSTKSANTKAKKPMPFEKGGRQRHKDSTSGVWQPPKRFGKSLSGSKPRFGTIGPGTLPPLRTAKRPVKSSSLIQRKKGPDATRGKKASSALTRRPVRRHSWDSPESTPRQPTQKEAPPKTVAQTNSDNPNKFRVNSPESTPLQSTQKETRPKTVSLTNPGNPNRFRSKPEKEALDKLPRIYLRRHRSSLPDTADIGPVVKPGFLQRPHGRGFLGDQSQHGKPITRKAWFF